MRGRKTNIEDFDIKINWVDSSTSEGKRSWENGIRILARMIAEAYIEEQKENTKLKNGLPPVDNE